MSLLYSDFIPPLRNVSQHMTCASVLKQNGAIIRMTAVNSPRSESRPAVQRRHVTRFLIWQSFPKGEIWQDSPTHIRIFQAPFVETMNSLADEGFPLLHTGKDKVFRVFCICCAVDSVARAPMHGISSLMQITAATGACTRVTI